uniref:Beta-defensin-like domain-containing protein n=1 Tax=Malurus cyaneus samueli TaxID=2593467 RepID=A0A8C5TB90_9PASS
MKILILLFPLILLFVQGAAGGASACRRKGGFCTIGSCRYPTTPVGKCSTFRVCCKRGLLYPTRQLENVQHSPCAAKGKDHTTA